MTMRLLDTYQKRRQEGQNLFLKNAKYIFNDHAVIVLFFLFGALAYQYSNWLSGLSQGLVGVWVHVIWAVLMTVGVFITGDRKSTRLNSSHVSISYDVYCL